MFMNKRILLSSLLVLSIAACTNPILNNTSQFSDLDKEYSQFKTQTLTQSYLKKKMDKWLSDSKYSKKLVREIEYAKFKHKDLLKDIVALQPIMFDHIIADTGVNQKRSEPSFEAYIQYINPYASTPVAINASNITSTSFTANWNAVTGATGYKIYIDGTPITLGLVTTYNISSLTGGTSHNYYVKAINTYGESSSSNTINLTLLSASPTAINATNITETSFKANWNTFNGATGYKLYLDGILTPITLGLVTSYDVTGLTRATPHSYYVKAILNTQDTPSSNTISLYTVADEFKVNSFTTNNQMNSAIAIANDGSFIITWESVGQDGDTTSYSNIYAQRYNADGSILGSEFRVNTYTTDKQQNPSIAMANNGSFVITWQGSGQDGDATGYYNIYAQKYNADGSVNGSEFRVNNYTANTQRYSSIAMNHDGKFVITWYGYGIGDSNGVFAQKYNADGSVNGSEFRVNTYTTNAQSTPSIAMSDEGKFIITWESYGQDDDTTSYSNIYAQRYNSDGTVNGSEFKVNSYTTNTQEYPSIAMSDDSKFIITWESYGQDGDTTYTNIYAQKYNADGSVNGSEFRVNTYTTNAQSTPSIAIASNGSFLITWHGKGNEDTLGIFTQRYNADGSTLGSEFKINTYTMGNQYCPSATIADDGKFVITWYGYGIGDSSPNYGVFAKRYDSNGNVL